MNESEALRQFIIERIREEGPVTFARFMEWCLYHGDYGYYGSGRVRIGAEGDYYTAPCVHPLFGGMIARQLVQMSELLGSRTFDVLEIGAGRGLLCEAVLGWLRRHHPALYARLNYHIMEPSPLFRREQRERLDCEVKAGRVHWAARETWAAGELAIEGCVLSNELVDAFPVHRVVFTKEELKEIHVDEKDGTLIEILGELSDPLLGDYFSDLGVRLAEGQTAEVNLQALQWLKEVAGRLQRGFVITLDYGDAAPELYDLSRFQGTLRCYFRHCVAHDPYLRTGGQDITCHVNFTALIQGGEALGLRLTGFAPQYRFLLALGLLEAAEEASTDLSPVESLKLRLSLKHLIEPERGMGECFKVLIQHKGIEKPKLWGLRSLGDFDPGRIGGQ